jgi:hypothetical protein
MKLSPVFAETCQRYIELIGKTDFLQKADALGVEKKDDFLVIPLYNSSYRVSKRGLQAEGGEKITPAVQVMICRYILTYSPDNPPVEDRLVTYREFKDSGPLISYFTSNTNKTLESAFAGNLQLFRKKAEKIGGEVLPSDTYDLSVRFFAFPRIPVIVNFNDRDDLFPAQSSILYRSTAVRYLDMECLAMTGTLLTGKLIAS